MFVKHTHSACGMRYASFIFSAFIRICHFGDFNCQDTLNKIFILCVWIDKSFSVRVFEIKSEPQKQTEVKELLF